MQRRKPAWVVAFYKFQFDARIRSEVWRLLGDLTREGLAESDAMDAMIDIYRQKKQGAIVYILCRLRYSIGMNTFNAECNKYVTTSEAIMFSSRGSAEASRIYQGAFRVIETQRTMTKTIYGTILHAVISFGVMLMLYYIFGTQLYPAFMDFSPLEEWSPFPRTVAIIALIYVDNLVAIFSGIIAFIFGLRWLIRNYTGPGRILLDKIPPFSLYRITTGVAFLMTIIERGRMGGALNTGMLQGLARQSTGYVRNRIENITRYADQQAGGIGSAAHLAGQGYPSGELALIMAKYSEQGGDWLDGFSAFMDSWIADIQNRIKSMAVGLNVLILFIVAASILIAMLSIFTIVNDITAIQ